MGKVRDDYGELSLKESLLRFSGSYELVELHFEVKLSTSDGV